MRTSALVDLQVNGYAGVDFNDAALTAEALDHALDRMRADGVGLCLPTLITATKTELAERFAALDRAVANSRLGAAMVPGYHLEGPFLNPTPGYAGCHPAAAMVPADSGLIQRLERDLSRPILLLTLAPEIEGAIETIRWCRDHGIVAAIGHSATELTTTQAAATAGATLSTHLGNALPQPQPKFFNPLMAQLSEDRLTASVIADGIHVAPHALKVILRAKGKDRFVLVTDATSAAASKPGLYPFAGMTIKHAADGSVREPGSPNLAGSALRLDQAIRNMVAWGFASFEEAVAMASDRPLRLLAPALSHRGIDAHPGALDWTPDLRPHAYSKSNG